MNVKTGSKDGDNAEYPAKIVSLLTKYNSSAVQKVVEKMSDAEFKKQKEKQTEYPIEGGAIGIVITNDDKIVLTRRSGPHSGWALPGGRVEKGEEFDMAFAREVLEECGVKIAVRNAIAIEDKVFVSESNEKISFWLATFESQVIDSDVPYRTEEAIKEGLEVGAFSLDKLPLDMVPGDKEKIMGYIKKLPEHAPASR